MRTSIFFVAALTCACLFCAAGCAKKPVAQAPAGYVTFQPSDQAFTCDAPTNWTRSGFAQMGTESGGTFVSGPAKISITSSMIGSILGELATANNNQAQNLASELGAQAPATTTAPPVASAHSQFAAAMVHQYPDYTETNTQPVTSPYGTGEVSEFTCSSETIQGYRATFLGKDRSIEIVCQCPPEDWAALSNGFMRVIQSVALGSGSND